MLNYPINFFIYSMAKKKRYNGVNILKDTKVEKGNVLAVQV